MSDKTTKPKRGGRPRADGRPSITRDDILRESAQLFAAHGFAATGIRSIAERIGAHATSIFNHFATKESILEELVELTLGSQLRLFEAVVAHGADPEVALYRLVYEDAMTCVEGNITIRSIFLLPELRTERFGAARLYWDRLASIYADLIAKGVAKGVFTDVPPRAAAEVLYVAGASGLVSLSTEKLGPPQAFAGLLADMALRALLSDPSDLSRIRDAALELSVNWRRHQF